MSRGKGGPFPPNGRTRRHHVAEYLPVDRVVGSAALGHRNVPLPGVRISGTLRLLVLRDHYPCPRVARTERPRIRRHGSLAEIDPARLAFESGEQSIRLPVVGETVGRSQQPHTRLPRLLDVQGAAQGHLGGGGVGKPCSHPHGKYKVVRMPHYEVHDRGLLRRSTLVSLQTTLDKPGKDRDDRR